VTRREGVVQAYGVPWAALSLCQGVTLLVMGSGPVPMVWWHGRPGELRSGVVDFEVAVDGTGDGVEVAGVGADDQVAAAQGSLDDARVDDVGGG
jgi:hypothetical protein